MSRIDSLMDLIGLGIKKTQPDPTTGTVSKLDEAILNMRQNKMQANQIENALMGMNAGVKRAEIQDTGLDRWLAQQGGSVTQEDIARYLDQQREPIGVQRYETEQYKPLESLPPLQHIFQSSPDDVGRLSISRGLETKGDLRSDDPAVFDPAAQDYRDWVVSRGGTPSQANYFIEKYRTGDFNQMPDESWGNGKFSIQDFASDRGYNQMAFQKPPMELDFVDPASGRRYQIEPTADRSLYRTYEHTGNERVPLKIETAPPEYIEGQRFPLNMDEALQAINRRRIEGTNTTKYSHMTDPGLDMTSYKEDVFTLPARDEATGFTHESHWSGVENPLVHLRSSHRELDDGGFSVHLEELQSDWHQKARQKGAYWSPENKDAAIDASEKANRKLTDLVKKGNFETDDIDMTDGFDSRVYYTNEFGDQYRLGTMMVDDSGKDFTFHKTYIEKFLPDIPTEKAEEMLKSALEAQVKVRNVREAPPDAPLKKDEWAWFGIKQAIRRAIDEGASGITLPTGEDMILKERVMGDAKLENTMRKMYDEKLPSIIKKIGKQYGVKPETRTIFYGEDAVERDFLPLTDEMIEKIMNEGMKKYGKQDAPRGILDSLGDMYV